MSPTVLGIYLNYSVFLYEIAEKTQEAIQMAKQASEDAIAVLDTASENEYKDAMLILQLLHDNISLWTSENEGK